MKILKKIFGPLLRGAFPCLSIGDEGLSGASVGIGSFVPGIASGLGSVASSAINAIAAGNASEADREFAGNQNELSRSFSRDQSATQMAFQERMSNSAYQRATADMEKAGINPALAFMKGGADTPSGSGLGASSQGASSTVAKVENPVSAGLSSAMEVNRMKNDNSMNAAQIIKTTADAKLSAASAKNVEATIPMTKRNAKLGTASGVIGEAADKISEGVSSSAKSFNDTINSGWDRVNEINQYKFDKANNPPEPRGGR